MSPTHPAPHSPPPTATPPPATPHPRHTTPGPECSSQPTPPPAVNARNRTLQLSHWSPPDPGQPPAPGRDQQSPSAHPMARTTGPPPHQQHRHQSRIH
ncbi:hypothetical protein CXF45_11040 [Corynebacterium bovis]|nr:hypothetical protein CXF45_11040 [Corynebacterium bovis]